VYERQYVEGVRGQGTGRETGCFGGRGIKEGNLNPASVGKVGNRKKGAKAHDGCVYSVYRHATDAPSQRYQTQPSPPHFPTRLRERVKLWCEIGCRP